MTHLNAFEADVEAKKGAVQAAKNELAVAEEALKAHPDYVAPKEVPKETPKEPVTTSSGTTHTVPFLQRDAKGHFLRNGK